MVVRSHLQRMALCEGTFELLAPREADGVSPAAAEGIRVVSRALVDHIPASIRRIRYSTLYTGDTQRAHRVGAAAGAVK